MFHEGQEILEKRYKVIKKLGGGAFGEIFRGNYHFRFSLPLRRAYSTNPKRSNVKHQLFYSREEKDG